MGPITIKPQPDVILEDELEWERQGKKTCQWLEFFYDLTYDVNIGFQLVQLINIFVNYT